MSRFKQYLFEEQIIEAVTADDDDVSSVAGTRKAIISLITTYLQRFVNSSEPGDNKSMLYLIAALNVLNSGEEDTYAVSTAKRLAQMALVRSGRVKKERKVK